MSKKVGVFIGRFQPLHDGHLKIINDAFYQNEYDEVLVLIGSANKSRSPKNPFTYQERYELFENALGEEIRSGKIKIEPIDDCLNDDDWIRSVTDASYRNTDGLNDTVHILGYNKDESSYYLSLFEDVFLDGLTEKADPIDATTIREMLYRSSDDDAILTLIRSKFNIPSTVTNETIAKIADDDRRQKEYDPKAYGPVNVLTADAVVIADRYRASASVLAVKRGPDQIGAGLWAIPGGHVEVNETLEQAAVRELKEETGVDVSGMVPDQTLIVDNPTRSAKARVVTAVHVYSIENRDSIYPVAGDDAQAIKWIDIKDISEYSWFEDHAVILREVNLARIKTASMKG